MRAERLHLTDILAIGTGVSNRLNGQSTNIYISIAGRSTAMMSAWWNYKAYFDYYVWLLIFFGLEEFWGQPKGPNFPSPQATMLSLRLDCSKAALTTPQKVLSIWQKTGYYFCL